MISSNIESLTVLEKQGFGIECRNVLENIENNPLLQ